MSEQRPKTSPILAVILGLLLLGGIVSLSIYVLPKVGLEASFMWTALVAGLGWIIATTVERKAEYRRTLAEEKRRLYYEFIDTIIEYLNRSQSGQEVELNKQELQRWSLRLSMVASDEVLRAWILIRRKAEDTSHEKQEPTEVLKPWGTLLVAMRKDCGHADSAVKPSDLLSAFVNDVHQHRDKVDR